MPTKFGKFISGKHFSKLFLILYILFICFAACETNSALCLLSGRTHLFGIPYILFALLAVPIISKKNVSAKWFGKTYKKAKCFLRCFLIYYSGSLALWELMCLISGVSTKTKAVGVIATIGICVVVVLLGYLHTKVIHTKRYNLTLGCDSEYRIALISDIHLGIFVGEKHVRKIATKINEIEPDIVVISGDIFDVDNSLLERPDELKRISKQFRKIKSKEGVYAVVGNHDPDISDKAFKHFLKASKIRLLNNDVADLSKITLIGRTDEANNERIELADILSKTDIQKPIVVLDHKPENIKEASEHGADLVLCGHTHRGQLFPVTLFTKWANGKGCFYGHNITEKTHSIITSGVGFFELPIRVGTNNEIADIHLQV